MEIKKFIKYWLLAPALLSMLFVQVEIGNEVSSIWQFIQSSSFFIKIRQASVKY